jgi:hypothetical protein
MNEWEATILVKVVSALILVALFAWDESLHESASGISLIKSLFDMPGKNNTLWITAAPQGE